MAGRGAKDEADQSSHTTPMEIDENGRTTPPSPKPMETDEKPDGARAQSTPRPTPTETSEARAQSYAQICIEYHQLRHKTSCKFCSGSPANVVFMPCRHMVMCEMCSNQRLEASRVCPWAKCGQKVNYTIKAIIP
ncbi:uncharacterized protein LOC110990199 [Acanthaster planci]|uniref:Uncharacterized protein LOC110990199 n=1 Tax=Acanthaster planci TaxID=133434 RepID=A0A8B8A195_ACAPL|nr:uncharacterized protein LOC110990199 [Acanthaster planci]